MLVGVCAVLLCAATFASSAEAISGILGTTGTQPVGIAVDSAGNIYTANYRSGSVSKITPGGRSTVFAAHGTRQRGIAVDSVGNIYTANGGSNNVSKITPGGTSTILGTTGSNPAAITIDSAGNLYTANFLSSNVSKITPGGTSTILAATGALPSAITVDSAGNLYTANYGSNNVSRITPDGTSTILAATGTSPYAITVDSAGNLYTANRDSKNVSKITPTVTNGLPDIFPAPPEKPSAPTAVVGSPGSGTATVTVAANPISAAFGTPSSYTITATQDESKQCVVTSPTTSCSVSGLTVGTAYTFTARANLNGWQTAASAASVAVTPTATPAPSNVFTVSRAKAKITGASIVLTTRVRVPGVGRIVQTATTKKGAKVTRRCRAAKTAAGAATYTLKCKIGKAGRTALRKAKMTLTVTTTFTPTGGVKASKTQTVKLVRRR